MTVDWSAGSYERTAAELEPAALTVVDSAELRPGDVVVDVACGTGNAALLAASRGARVIGVDAASRLLELARERALDQRVDVDLRRGDLLALPVSDGAADVVLSVFGVIFAADPAAALQELARIARPRGRVILTAWVPAGPIDAMLAAMGRILGRITQAPPSPRFRWDQPEAVRALAAEAGLELASTSFCKLPIRDSSPEAYVTAGREHPMALAVRPVIEGADAEAEVQEAMTAVLREANEDSDAFLVHSPYVVHELRVGLTGPAVPPSSELY